MTDKVLTVLVCPAELLREGISKVLDGSHFDVIAAGPSVETITPLVGSKHPALAVLVVQRDGMRASCREIFARFPETRIAVVASGLTRRDIGLMRECRVGGFLYHTISRDNLLNSLHLVLNGMCVLPSLLNEYDIAPDCDLNSELPDDGSSTESEPPPPKMEGISDRELLVLKSLAAGASNKVIARRLGITDSTVKVHLKSLFRKTKMSNRVQLALWAASRVGPLLSQQPASPEPPEIYPKLPPGVLGIAVSDPLAISSLPSQLGANS